MTRGFQTIFSIVILTSCVSGGSESSPQRTQATVQEPVQVEEKIKSSVWNLTLTVTDLSGRPIPKAEIVMEDGTGEADFRLTDGNGFSHFSTFQGERQVSIQASGYKNFVHRVLLMDDAHLDVVLERDYRSARRGRVSLAGRVLSDDEGPLLAVGSSLFWAAWAYKHDRVRLERNLEWLAGYGFDYIRAVGMVGAQPFWAGREVQPSTADYWVTIEGVTDLAYDKYGLRVQWVIFADAQVMMPDEIDRVAWVDRWAEFANLRPEKILFLELANEFWKNGLNARELVDLTSRLGSQTEVLVSASSPAGHDCASWEAVYRGGQADLATIHFDRDGRFPEGKWRPVHLPWKFGSCLGMPPAASNNEPIGPNSSVVSDDDPIRIVSSAVMTFVSQLSAYVYHSRAGIRGDVNLWDEERADEIALGLQQLKRYLPVDLPNWERQGHRSPQHPFAPSLDGQLWPEGGTEGVVRAYGATSGNQFFVVPIGIRGRVTLVPRYRVSLDLIDLITGVAWAHHELEAGEKLVLLGRMPTVVIRGKVLGSVS